jgi:Ca2+-binding EF-hand superfamily protein
MAAAGWWPKVITSEDSPAVFVAHLYSQASRDSSRPSFVTRGEHRGKFAANRDEILEHAGDRQEGRPSIAAEHELLRQLAEFRTEGLESSSSRVRLGQALREHYVKRWGDLSRAERQAGRRLGWNQWNWDSGNTTPCRDRTWQQLDQEGQAAARLLLFSPRTWAASGAKARGRGFRRRRTTAAAGGQPASTFANFVKSWRELSTKQQQAGRVLGWNQPSWDSGDGSPCSDLTFAKLKLSSQAAAKELGFDSLSWDMVASRRRQTFLEVKARTGRGPDLYTKHPVSVHALGLDKLADISAEKLSQIATQLIGYKSLPRLCTADVVKDLVSQVKARNTTVVRQTERFHGALVVQKKLVSTLWHRGINVAQAFRAFDRDGDGQISRREFSEGLQALEIGITGRQIEDLLLILDRDGDGTIDYREFTNQFGGSGRPRGPAVGAAHGQINAGGVRGEIIATFRQHGVDVLTAFKAFDRDGDGQISRREFSEGLQALRIGINDWQIEQLLYSLNKDVDGQISYREFAAEFGGGGAGGFTGAHIPEAMGWVSVYGRSTSASVAVSVFDVREAIVSGIRKSFASLRESFTKYDRRAIEEISRHNFSECLLSLNVGVTSQHVADFLYLIDMERRRRGDNAHHTQSGWTANQYTITFAEFELHFGGYYDLFELFARFDNDGSMTLRGKDFAAALRSIPLKLSSYQLSEVLTSAVDISDESDKLDYLKFCKQLTQTPAVQKAARLKSIKGKLAGIMAKHAAICLDTFKKLDLNGGGFVNAIEIRTGLLGLGINLKPRDIDDLMIVASVNDDQQINYSAFIEQFRSARLAQLAKVRTEMVMHFERYNVDLPRAFRALDRDGDGQISAPEFRQALRALDIGLTAQHIDDVLELIDQDGDGTISFQEFIRMFTTSFKNQHMFNEGIAIIRSIFRRHIGYMDYFHFSEADTIDWNEFARGMQLLSTHLNKNHLGAVWAHIDVFKSGFIERNVFRRHFYEAGIVKNDRAAELQNLSTQILIHFSELGLGISTAFDALSWSVPERISRHDFREGLKALNVRASADLVEHLFVLINFSGSISAAPEFIERSQFDRHFNQAGVFGLARAARMAIIAKARQCQGANMKHVRFVTPQALCAILATVNVTVKVQEVSQSLALAGDLGDQIDMHVFLSELQTALSLSRRSSGLEIFWEALYEAGPQAEVVFQARFCSQAIPTTRAEFSRFLQELQFRLLPREIDLIMQFLDPECTGTIQSIRQLCSKLPALYFLTHMVAKKIGECLHWHLSMAAAPDKPGMVSAQILQKCMNAATTTKLDCDNLRSDHAKGVSSYHYSGVWIDPDGFVKYDPILEQMGNKNSNNHLFLELRLQLREVCTREDNTIKELFHMADIHKRGALSAREFHAFSEAIGVHMRLHQIVDAWSFMHQDRGGRVAREEFVAMLAPSGSTILMRQLNKQFHHRIEQLNCTVIDIFSEYATGAIMTTHEFEETMHALSIELSRPQLHSVISQLEKKSMSSHGISFNTFAHALGPSADTAAKIRSSIRARCHGEHALFQEYGNLRHEAISRRNLEIVLGKLDVELDAHAVEVFLLGLKKGQHGYKCSELLAMINAVDIIVDPETEKMHGHATPSIIAAFRRKIANLVQQHKVSVSALFVEFDRNRNKLISRIELQNGMSQYGFYLNEEQLAIIFGLSGLHNVSAGLDKHRFDLICGNEVMQKSQKQRSREKAKQHSKDKAEEGQIVIQPRKHKLERNNRIDATKSKSLGRATFFVNRIRSSLRDSRVDVVQLFHAIDINKDGHLDRRELRRLMQQTNVSITETQMDDIMLLLGKHAPNRIGYQTFIRNFGAKQNHTNATPRSPYHIRSEITIAFRKHGVDVLTAFKAFDRDGDGQISRREFSEGLQALRIGITVRQIEDLLQLLDRDGDGRINYREFVAEFGGGGGGFAGGRACLNVVWNDGTLLPARAGEAARDYESTSAIARELVSYACLQQRSGRSAVSRACVLCIDGRYADGLDIGNLVTQLRQKMVDGGIDLVLDIFSGLFMLAPEVATMAVRMFNAHLLFCTWL